MNHQIHWFPIGMAIFLAVLSFWLNHLTADPANIDHGGFAHEPDTIVENFNALTYNEEGKPWHRISAAKLTHYMDDDTTTLDRPRFRLLVSSQTPTEVSADRGHVSSDGENVHFLGNVQLTRHIAGTAPLSLQTEYLWIIPSAGIMRTDQRVTLQQGKANVTAQAMLINNKSKQFTLSGGVKGHYE
jgi:lipopolysaccharide export system protein LptC